MRKRFITRTIKFENLEVTVYNKADECLEQHNVTLREMSEKDRVKEIEESFKNFKVVDVKVVSTEEKLLKMTERRFIEECEREEAEE